MFLSTRRKYFWKGLQMRYLASEEDHQNAAETSPYRILIPKVETRRALWSSAVQMSSSSEMDTFCPPAAIGVESFESTEDNLCTPLLTNTELVHTHQSVDSMHMSEA